MWKLFGVGFLLLATACGAPETEVEDDGGGSPVSLPDLEGMYEVSYHTLARSISAASPVDCSVEGEAIAEPTHFQMVPGFIDGYDMEDCSSSDPESCTFTFWSFDEGSADGWRGTNASTQTGGGTECNLYYDETEAIVQADGSLRIVLKEWASYNEVTAEECTLEAAEALGEESHCMRYEVISGIAY